MSGTDGRQHSQGSKAASGVWLYFSSAIITITMYRLCSGQPLANTVTQTKLSLTFLHESTLWQWLLIPAWQNYVSISDERAAWIAFYNVIHIHHGSSALSPKRQRFSTTTGYLSSLCRALHWTHWADLLVYHSWLPNCIAEVVFFSSTSRLEPGFNCLIASMLHITLFIQKLILICFDSRQLQWHLKGGWVRYKPELKCLLSALFTSCKLHSGCTEKTFTKSADRFYSHMSFFEDGEGSVLSWGTNKTRTQKMIFKRVIKKVRH